MNQVRWSTMVLALLVIGCEVPVCAMMIRIDGSADFRVIAMDRAALLCTRYVSGDKAQHLFALDPQTGAELWRWQSSNRTWCATVQGAVVYHETGGTLYKRILTNGGVLWQTALDSLPPHRVKPPFTARFKRGWNDVVGNLLSGNAPVWSGGAPTPSSFGYPAPIITGGNLLMARSASTGGGCVVQHCFADWFLMDPGKGKVLRSGPGQFQGEIGTSALFSIPDTTGTSTVAFVIRQGERRDIPPLVTTDSTRIDPVGLFTESGGPISACGPRQLFTDPDDSGAILIVDQQQDKVTRLASASIRSREAGTWELLPDALLNYVDEWQRASARKRRGDSGPSIVLFDLQGQRLGSMNVLAPSGVHSWSIDYVGFLGLNVAVFARLHSSPKPATKGAPREPVADDLLLLEVPSMKVQRVIELGPRPIVADGVRAERSFHTSPDSPLVFNATGNVTFYTMTSNAVPHELRVEAYDTTTGKLAWRHTEAVTVRKF